MSYRAKSKGNYGNQKHGGSAFKGKKSVSDWNDLYVKGNISEQTWRRHMNEDRRANAPSIDVVMSKVSERAKQAGAVSSDTEGFQGWTNWDTWELMLLLDNTQASNKWLDAWADNFGKKIEQGKFNPEEAEKVVANYLIPVARGTKKPLFYDQYHEFTPDENIDPKKVNKAEVVSNLLQRYRENKA